MQSAANAHVAKRLLPVLLTVSISSTLLFGCSAPPGFEKDLERPKTTITYPMNGAVLGDSILVKAQASDNESVIEVEFIIDGVVEYTDFSAPYMFNWRLGSYEIGSTHTLQTAASDGAGNRTLSEIVGVSYQWTILVDDADDPWEGDVLRAYARDDSAAIDFRIEIDCALGTCPDSEVTCTAVFLDTDLDSATGDPGHPAGSDYLLYACFHKWTDYKAYYFERWEPSYRQWTQVAELDTLGYNPDHTVLRVQLSLSDIGMPDTVIIVFSGTIETSKGAIFDWAPDRGQEPIVYPLDGLYLGKPTADDVEWETWHSTRTQDRRFSP